MTERGDHDGHTIALQRCTDVPGGACPPLEEWPTSFLIFGQCPRCGQVDEKAWRMAVARRLEAAA